MREAVAPADCLSFIGDVSSSGMMDWRDMVEVEHCDRMKRLERISNVSLGIEPQFYDASITAGRNRSLGSGAVERLDGETNYDEEGVTPRGV